MKKVLIVKLSSLGDIIFTLPLANVLKANECEVHWLVTERGIDIVKDNPCVDKTIFLPLYKWRKNPFSFNNFIEMCKIISEIRKEKYDIALDCQKRFKSLIYMFFSGAKRRIITDGAREFSYFGANEHFIAHTEKPHMVYRNLAYADYLGYDITNIKFTLPEISNEIKNKIDNLLKDADKSKPLVIIAPATTWDTKHWNINNWKKLILALKDKCCLVFTGTAKDKELISCIGGDEYINLAGLTNIKDLMELFSRADLVIAPDSGSAHLAWASQKPAVISLFTCTSPHIFGCFGDDKKYFPLSGELKCQFCYKRKCPSVVSSGLCTQFPDADYVINLAQNIIESKYNSNCAS